MAIAILIYFGLGACVALWAITGSRSHIEVVEVRRRVIRRLGILRTVGTIVALWPYILGLAFVRAGREAA